MVMHECCVCSLPIECIGSQRCWSVCAGQEDLCESFWSKQSVIEEPLRHFLHESRGLYPQVIHPFL